MGKQRFFIALATFCLAANVIAKSSDNPFKKSAIVDIGSDAEWVIANKTATLSGSDSGTFYHFSYNRKQLRLRITSSAVDSEAVAKHYDQFAINDVLLDGKRLPVFQWCLNHQERHKRFLQQGLKVKKDVCKNQGEVGTFSMRLNVATLDMLKKGKKLTYNLKPFRSDVAVTFDISGFSDVVAKLDSREVPMVAVSVKKCKASPPTGFAKVKAVEYSCVDAAAKTKATASVNAAVSKERELRKKVAAEREKKRLATEKAKAEKLATQKAAEEKLAAEQAAIAASAAQQQAISSEIAVKMIAMCQKKWDKGEHRCYCEKYISHAPKEIQESSACSGS